MDENAYHSQTMQFIAQGLPLIKMALNKKLILFEIAKNSKCLFDPLLTNTFGGARALQGDLGSKTYQKTKVLKVLFLGMVYFYAKIS